MLRLFPLALWLVAASAAVVTYDFNLTYVTTNPDGLGDRKTIGINGAWPPPVMHANRGDTILINVLNSIEQSITFHFHGMYQNGTNQMDGPSMVTQCPIPPGSSMSYNVTATEVGTHWYHCHVDYCYPNGYRQAFIVHDDESYFYNQTDQEVLITLSDWYHEEVQDLAVDEFMCLFNPSGAEPIPDSFLFNDGVNQSIYVEPGKTYYLHMINVGGFVAQYFYIEDHNFTIVEVDGIYVEPAEANLIYVAPGQRYGLLLTAKNTTDANYAIVTVADSQMLDSIPYNVQLNQTNWLVYNNASELPEATMYVSSSMDLVAFDDIDLVPYDRMELLPEPDLTLLLTLNFDTLDDGENYGVFNDISYTAPKVPTLYTVLSAGSNLSANDAIYGTYTHAVVLEHNQVVEVIMNNADTGTHPLYLHGHNFQIIARAPSYSNYYAYADLAEPVVYDVNNHSAFMTHPVRRDVGVIPPQGWFVLRFKADNPGVWLFHCQVDWHLGSGLGMLFVEAPDLIPSHIGAIPESHYAACAAGAVPTAGNAAGNAENFLDLDGMPKQKGFIPGGFTSRGEAAMAFNVLSALLGIVAIAWYGMADLKHQVTMVPADVMAAAGGHPLETSESPVSSTKHEQGK